MENLTPTLKKNRLKIENAAMELILAKGIEATTISDISAKTAMQRRTVYNHFASKELIVKSLFDKTSKKIIEALNVTHDYSQYENGFKRIKHLFKNYVSTILTYKEEACFIVHYDYYYASKIDEHTLFDVLGKTRFDNVLELFNEGIKDGSINLRGHDPLNVFMIMGVTLFDTVAKRLYQNAEKQSLTYEEQTFIHSLSEILLEGIRNPC